MDSPGSLWDKNRGLINKILYFGDQKEIGEVSDARRNCSS